MKLWRRLVMCKTRSRFLLLAFWYCMVALSVYVLYSLKAGHQPDDAGANTWRQSRFFSSLLAYGRHSLADDGPFIQRYKADNIVGELRVAVATFEDREDNREVAIDSSKHVQQLILRNSGAAVAGESGDTDLAIVDDVNDTEQRTFDVIEEEEEVEEVHEFHEPPSGGNRTNDDDRKLAVTSTIDLTSIHFVNATVKPTPPPEVEGYYHVKTNENLRARCSRCALVSSSGHLINTSAGADIDSYPCVLRMNSAPVRGYEDDVGSRTTIRIMGHVNLKVLNASNELQDEILKNATTRAEKIIVPWLYNVKINQATDMYYKSAHNLSKLYPEVDFYFLTPDKMKIAESLFQTETGLTRQEAHTWLSTGWMSMLFAVDVCDKVDIYGLVPENFCIKFPNASNLYHYYEPDGLKECDYYHTSEEKLTSGHKFITEKAVFARWATKFNLEFHHPVWNLTDISRNASIETPFLRMFYEAKRAGTLPKVSNGTGRVIRRVVKRVVKKVIIRRKIPVVQKKAIPHA